jgi:lipopolysaccharide/colanic/teichoic acid biosynthesis glycosyltransferase
MTFNFKNEPKESFPYLPPSSDILIRYNYLFKIKYPLPIRISKVIFDKFLSAILLLLFLPLLIILKIMYLFEGVLLPDNKGDMFFFYNAVSGGSIIKKYKIRIIKEKYIDKENAKLHNWIAYSAEWNPECRTFIGNFVKKFYIDEIPQLWSVFIGDMSIVGPRPLSILHYERDLEQGNISRRLIRGGLLGLGHINKGTVEMGNPLFEYEYIEKYVNYSPYKLFILDIIIIWRGIVVIFKGGGH